MAKRKKPGKDIEEADSDLKLDLQPSQLIRQGAEARVYHIEFRGRPTLVKERFAKSYRIPELDQKITKARTLGEVRCVEKMRAAGVDTPQIYALDLSRSQIAMEYITGCTVRDYINSLDMTSNADERRAHAVATRIGEAISRVHAAGVIHGDLTTSNMMLRTATAAIAPSATATTVANGDKKVAIPAGADTAPVVMIDFGLSYVCVNKQPEDKAVDLYVLERAFLSTHPSSEKMFAEVLRSYEAHGNNAAALAAGAETKSEPAVTEPVAATPAAAAGNGDKRSSKKEKKKARQAASNKANNGKGGKGGKTNTHTATDVITKLEDVRARGRKRDMTG